MRLLKTKKRQGSLFNRTGRWFTYIILTITLVFWILTWVGSNYYTFELAFTEEFAGVKRFTWSHFEAIFIDFANDSSLLFIALKNTMKYWILSLVMSFVSLFCAYIIYKKVYFSNVYIVIIHLPTIISGVVYISVFKNLFVTYGPMWSLLYDVFGVEMSYPFTDPEMATPMILAYSAWLAVGTNMFVYIGIMNRIPNEVLEAAQLDGCSTMQEFRSIIFPILLSSFLAFIFPIFTGIFMSTGPILYFTGTNEYMKTYTLNFYIYVSTLGGKQNSAAAMGLITTLATIPIVIAVRFIMKKVDTDVQF